MTNPYLNSFNVTKGRAIELEEMKEIAEELQRLKFDYDQQTRQLRELRRHLYDDINDQKDLKARTGLHVFDGAKEAYHDVLHTMDVMDI